MEKLHLLVNVPAQSDQTLLGHFFSDLAPKVFQGFQACSYNVKNLAEQFSEFVKRCEARGRSPFVFTKVGGKEAL